MTTEYLEIQPQELSFTFEAKKQSSCSIQLGNKSDHYVAYKVKTTSPKKYCVRPNTGIIKPKSKCDFTVTMQAQRMSPPDMQCKDKFLVQSTIVAFGTTEEDITPGMFSKDSAKHIEEKKLKVILKSPPPSPVLLPVNGESKQDPCHETSMQKDRKLSGVENVPPLHKNVEDIVEFETCKDMDELRVAKDAAVTIRTAKGMEELEQVKDVGVTRSAEHVEELKLAKDGSARSTGDTVTRPTDDVEELRPAKDAVVLNLTRDLEALKSELKVMDSKLREAELTITKLTEDSRITTKDKEMLKRELETSKTDCKGKVQVGFPLLYVIMVALISLALGYTIHA